MKQNWLTSHSKALRENGFWIGRIQNALLKGTDLHSVLQYEKMVKSMSPAQVQAAAKHYFNTANYVQVVLYPEKPAAAVAAPASTAATVN